MSLLALVPFPYRILALVLLAVALMGFGWVKGAEHGAAKLDARIAAEQVATIAAMRAASEKTQALQLKKDEALHAAADREKKLRTDVAGVRAERDGLRDDLASTPERLSSASPDSLRLRVATLEDVFGQCAGRYSGVAEEADRSTSNALTLEQAWPR